MLIIDTYNVLHVRGILPPRLAGAGVADLVRLISASRYANRRITLVCDGGPTSSVSGVRMHDVHILYAGSHLEADDVIEQFIDRYHKGNSLDVVSTDRRLRRAARRRGARSITSERFLQHLVEDEGTPKPKRGHVLRAQVPLDAYSVGQWCLEFGLNPPRRETKRDTGNAGKDPPASPPPPARSKNRSRTSPASTIGEQLRIDLPHTPPPSPPPNPATTSRPPAEPTPRPGLTRGDGQSRDAAPAGDVDPQLLEALEEWRDRLTLDDLDMQRWLPDVQPMPRKPGPPRKPRD